MNSIRDVDGILVPGGFGDRGVEGKILCDSNMLVKKSPFLGICLGMQLATIEFARNVLGLEGAHSSEIRSRIHHIQLSIYLPEQKDVEDLRWNTSSWAYIPCKLD